MRFIRLFIVPMALGLVPDDLSHLFDADRAEYPVLEFMSDLSPPPLTGVFGDRSAVRLGQNQVRVEFSEKYMRSLDRRIAASYRGQLVMDEFFSQLTPTPKKLEDRLPSRTVSLGRRMMMNWSSIVYHAKDDPTTIIKYQSDCGSLRKLHPAFLNHHFQGLAAAAGLAPRVGFLSPGMIVLPGSSAKFPFDATPAQLLNCHNAGGSIRLLEMDKAGRSLWNYGRKKTVLVAARLGIRMITLVKRLHEDAGIVHGDIHNGNFLFSTDNEDDPLMLIDFERSGYADQLVDSRVIYNLKVHYMHSPWEALGYRRSRRDDVYRTVYSIAQIMQDSAWLNFEQHQVATDAAASIVRKRTEFIFASPSFDPIERMRATKVIKTRVRELLWDVLHAARSPKTPNDRPRYEDILEALSQIANLLAPQ